MKRAIVFAGLILLVSSVAGAQSPTLTITPDVVVAGGATTATITGPPGHFFAIAVSSTGAGIAVGGVNLALGPDAQLLTLGQLDPNGRAVLSITPPFFGSVLDRAYYQVATSPSSAFASFQLSAGRIVKNGDLLAGVQGPAGPQGPPGATGATGPAGATGPPGANGAGLVFRGDWNPATTYGVSDSVYFQGSGSSYVSLQANNTNHRPDLSPPFWNLLAAAAAPGPPVYGDFSAVMPPDNAAGVATGSDIVFPQDGPIAGGIVRVGLTTFALPAGTYEIGFQVSVLEAGQLALALDGVVIPRTIVGRAMGSSQIVGMAMVTFGPGSLLSVRNVSPGAITLAPSAGGGSPVTAHLTVRRVN